MRLLPVTEAAAGRHLSSGRTVVMRFAGDVLRSTLLGCELESMRRAKQLTKEVNKLSRKLTQVFEHTRELQQESQRLGRQLDTLMAQSEAIERQDTIEKIRLMSRRAPRKSG